MPDGILDQVIHDPGQEGIGIDLDRGYPGRDLDP